MTPCPTVAQTRLDPIAVVTMSFALDVQVGAIPGRPGAGSDSRRIGWFIARYLGAVATYFQGGVLKPVPPFERLDPHPNRRSEEPVRYGLSYS